jgi:hypothetical protein
VCSFLQPVYASAAYTSCMQAASLHTLAGWLTGCCGWE